MEDDTPTGAQVMMGTGVVMAARGCNDGGILGGGIVMSGSFQGQNIGRSLN
jgi:hypothetical protein